MKIWTGDIDFLARTMWGEARGDGEEGMRAVGHVILNRMSKHKASLTSVIFKPFQFSCWNPGDLNRNKALRVDESDEEFSKAKVLATEILFGDSEDSTKGSTHYHSTSVQPGWSTGHSPAVVILRHAFYNDVQ